MGEPHERILTAGGEGASSPAAWAHRLRQGEPDAVQEVRKRISKILAYGGLSIPGHEREDLEQEIVTEIWQAVTRSRFDRSGGFWGFVEVVASRRCIDWLRARKEKLPLPAEVTCQGTGPLRHTLERERSELVTTLLLAVDSRCRELIGYRLADELSYGEIAELTGRTEGALRVQLYRCLRQARRVLERLTAKPSGS